MDFNIFAQSRDLLCLAGAFAGLAAGFFLSQLNKAVLRRSRSRRTTLALLFLSGTVAALAGAVVISRNMILRDNAVIIASLSCIPVCALAVCFPRAVAYPLILAAGLAAVWLGYTFLRFPLIQASSTPAPAIISTEGTVSARNAASVDAVIPLAAIAYVGGNRYTLNLAVPAISPAVRSAADGKQPVFLYITGSLSSVEFSADFIRFERYIPLIGGTIRGAITQISRETETLYTDTAIQSSLAFRLINANAKVPFDSIPLGTELSVFYDNGSLSFAAAR